MKFRHLLLTIGVVGLLGTFVRAHDKNAPLNDEQKNFLAQYETVRAALAAADLSATKKAASAIVAAISTQPPVQGAESKHPAYLDAALKIAAAGSINEAREAFIALSKQALHLADGQKGYYVIHCKMFPKDEGNWVQTTKKISNPYFGKEMPTCGSIKE